MSNTFILGIEDTIDGSYLLPTRTVYDLTGQNLGNLAFHYAMVKILGRPQEALPWHTDPSRLNAMARIGVMPCANQLGPHSDLGRLAERFSSLTIPLVALGLGAQGDSTYNKVPELPTGSQEWVRQIAKRSAHGFANIGVRGPFTLKLLEHYGLADNAVVTGCPTLFLNPNPNLGEIIERRAKRPIEHIAVAAGHQKWKHLSKIEASLVKLMEATGGSYIVQSPVEMVMLARGEADLLSPDDFAECRDYIHPELDRMEFVAWTRQYSRAFFNVSEWMEFLRGFDFVVGARIHGVVLGLQAGIPSLCIAHDSRTRELCEVMHVPFVMANEVIQGLSSEDLQARFVFDGKAFDANRRKLALDVDTLFSRNDIVASAWLKDISRS